MGTGTRWGHTPDAPNNPKLHAGLWWRATRYELRTAGGLPPKGRGVAGATYRPQYTCIAPARGALIEHYDPWKAWERQRPPSKDRITPYQELLNLLEDLRYEHDERIDDDVRPNRIACGRPLTPESANALLAWCARWGLLGVLLHRTASVTLAPHAYKPIAGGRSLPAQYRCVRMPNGWIREEIISSSVTTEAVMYPPLSSVDRPVPRRERLGDTWAAFFPKVPPERAETYRYPIPLSQEFWGQYAEPVADFLDAALTLKAALQGWELADRGGRIDNEAVARGQGALDRLDSVAETTSLYNPKESRIRLLAPSLIGAFKAMAVRDAAGGSVVQCPCGIVFVGSAQPTARYCSESHRERYKKRKQREAAVRDRAKTVRRRQATR